MPYCELLLYLQVYVPKKDLKNPVLNFGKTALSSVVGSKKKSEGLGNFPTSKNAAHFTERVPLSYACCVTSLSSIYERTGKEWNGNEQLKTGVLQ